MLLDYNIKYLDIITSDYCQKDCKFCCANLKGEKQWLNIDNINKCLDFVWGIGVREIIVGGGEPTIFPDLERLLITINKYDFEKIWLTTNGLILSRSQAIQEMISKYITNLNLSVISFDADRQELFGGTKQIITIEEYQNISNFMHDNSVDIRVNNTVFKNNNDSVLKMKEFVDIASQFADDIRFTPLFKTEPYFVADTVNEFVTKNILGDDEYNNLFNSFCDMYSEYTIMEFNDIIGVLPYKTIKCNIPIMLDYCDANKTKFSKDRGDLNNLKLLSNGILSYSWNKKSVESILHI